MDPGGWVLWHCRYFCGYASGLRYAVSGIINVADVETILNAHMKPPTARASGQAVPEPPRYGPEVETHTDADFYATGDDADY